MHRLYIIGTLVISLFWLFYGSDVQAMSQNVVISQVQLSDATSVKDEFVELYNNSNSDVEITNWCLYYVTTSQTASKMVCFAPSETAASLYIPGHSYLLAVSNELTTAKASMAGDFHFTSTLSGVGGNVRLQNDLGAEVDKVGWGVSAPELDLVAAAPAGNVLGRKSSSDSQLQDTDVNSSDFEVILPRDSYQFGLIYEVRDVCPNISGAQAAIPTGYAVDGSDCVLAAADLCANLEGLQATLPVGMKQEGENCSIVSLIVSELLPDALGADIDNEFIELYNPNAIEVNLNDYAVYIGPSYSHAFQFPVDAVIQPGEYEAFYNDQMKFTLLNSSGGVMLKTLSDLMVYETPVYDNPIEGESWALIDSIWQYTNSLTPGARNQPSTFSTSILANILAPCSAGQERNPETGRCRKTSSATSVLMPCKDGQYRSEETNRCRSIAADVSSLAICAEGQERNPKTNRCRSIATNASGELTPCPAGQERNPKTNRCRKVNQMVSAGYAPEKTKANDNPLGWWVLGGVGLVATLYGIWEWRQEIVKFCRRMKLFIRRRK